MAVMVVNEAAMQEEWGRDGPEGFDRFHRASRERIGRALALTLRNGPLGYEAVDEAMARAWARWSSVSAMDNPDGWVYRVGLNWGRSGLRRLRRETLTNERADGVHTDPPSFDSELSEAVDGLSPKLRAVIVCRFHLDWSVAETAAALGAAEGTVKSRCNRALADLAERLGEES